MEEWSEHLAAERYTRQLGMLGEDGQRKMQEATVFVAGIGGLGGTAALYLAAAGIGKLILAHEGIIALPDLNRQILMEHDKVGEGRISSAIESIHRLNPHVEIEAYPAKIEYEPAKRWIQPADIVIDARYDFPERYELNRACSHMGKPMVEAAMYGFEISLTTIIPGTTPCLACMYPQGDNAWKPLGFPVLGAVSGIAGCMAALEAVKWITGIGDLHTNRMIRLNSLDMTQNTISLEGIPACPDCAERHHGSGA